jgi:hypothetical protein
MTAHKWIYVDLWQGAESFSITQMQVMTDDSYNMYSYNVPNFGNLAYEGGWKTQADIGPDILYQEEIGNPNSAKPLTWNNADFAAQYHNNDPNVIQGAAHNQLYMYFTSLDNKYTSLEDITNNNWITLAVSNDKGTSWTDLGQIYKGWSPSALWEYGKVDVFYNTASAETQMVQFGSNGTNVISEGKTLMDITTNSPIHAINVSVCADGNLLVLVGNDAEHYGHFGDILAYVALASDPYSWKPLLKTGSTFIQGGNVELLTPEIHYIGNNSFDLTFTENLALQANGLTPNPVPQHTVTMDWVFQLH